MCSFLLSEFVSCSFGVSKLVPWWSCLFFWSELVSVVVSEAGVVVSEAGVVVVSEAEVVVSEAEVVGSEASFFASEHHSRCSHTSTS